MSTSGLQATKCQKEDVKELTSMKESISDIINQLQDIDPARLSFSPFLDLDTQISLAPVSDSPESSVEELHSPSHSMSGSQRSLEAPLKNIRQKSSASCCQQPRDSLMEPERDQTDGGGPDQTLSSAVITTQCLDAAMENSISTPTPAFQGDVPNGRDAPRWSPESTNLDCTTDEGRPLIGPPPESVELTVWRSEGQAELSGEVEEASDRRRCHCQCRCCQSGRVPALFSVLASALFASGVFYGLYFYVPIKPPDCPDTASRLVFSLCCCAAAAFPILLAMLVGSARQFCSASFDLQDSFPSGRAVHQLFVTASSEQLLLYIVNLVVMAWLLPQEQLKLVPIVAAMFIFGRLVYWVCLSMCSSWRGFGSGLTFFPLLSVVALNLFLVYTQNLHEPLFVSQDVLYNQATPSPWSGGASQSSRAAVPPTDILDAQ